jgi:hypothetical protein
MNDKLVNANGKHVRLQGNVYRIISCRLGKTVLAEAENVKTGDRTNIMRSGVVASPFVKSIREMVKLNLFV